MSTGEQQESLITPEMKALIGKETESRTAADEVTVSEIRRFAQATFDENPLYYDADYASSTKFGGLVGPGPFTTHMPGRRPFGDPDLMLDPTWDGETYPPKPGEAPARIQWPDGYYNLHGADELEIHQLARPGERISSKRRIVDIYDREGRSGRLGLTITETVFTNEKGEVLAINRNTMVARKIPTS
jgi:acyl dehydratase